MRRVLRRPIAVVAFILAAAVVEVALVHIAVRFNLAQAILASGNTSPPPLALALIVALMGLRLFVIVIAPGAVLASAVYVIASFIARKPKPSVTQSA